MNYTFSLIYASRRPKQIFDQIERWLARAANPDSVEVVVAVDSDDNYHGLELGSRLPHVSKCLHQGAFSICVVDCTKVKGNCVRAWNAGAEKSSGTVLIAISDDFDCPEFWDAKLLEKFPVHPNGGLRARVLRVKDGYCDQLCTLPIMTRSYYARFGYIYYPGYKSMYCDTELTEVSRESGLLIECDLLFEHRHYDARKRVKDEVDVVHGSKERYDEGREIFEHRKANGFYDPEFAVQLGKCVAFCLCIRNDFSLGEVLERLIAEGALNVVVGIPSHYWDLTPTSESDIENITRTVKDVVWKTGTPVSILRQDVVSLGKFPSLVMLEAAVRQRFIDMLRNSGYQHIFVVDDDELWRSGTLKKLIKTISAYHPDSVSTTMVPVAGVPGWPIEGAFDTAIVYQEATVPMKECRTPDSQSIWRDWQLIHFTAVRKTSGELAQKMRRSGHYDDPRYKFEEWITEKMDKLFPGMTNAHMYITGSTWPLIRAWRETEWNDIPDTLKQYLGTTVEKVEARRVVSKVGKTFLELV